MTNELPLHPSLVHLPVALAALVPLLSAAVLIAWWRGWFGRGTWALVVGTQTLLVASGLLAMRTGEAEEERVEAVVPHAAFERHEEAAELFQWGAGAVLVLGMLPLLLRNARLARGSALVATVGSAVVLGLAYRVGHAGGELVYRYGAAAAYAGATDGVASPASMRDDDDR